MMLLNNKKGFTLIELIIVIVVIGIIMGGVVSAFAFGMQFFSDEDSSIGIQENLRFVAVNFEKDVRKSTSQSVTTSAPCATIDTVVYCLVGTNIERNSVVIAHDIAAFIVYSTIEYIDLEISSIADDRGNDVSISTRIYLRRGD